MITYNIPDSPTVILAALPPALVEVLTKPGTSPMRKDAILRAIVEEELRRKVDPKKLLPAVMQRLFMSTMAFYHRHSFATIPLDLRLTLTAMQQASHDPGASHWAITVVAVKLIEASPALNDPAVYQAIWQARNIVQPVL